MRLLAALHGELRQLGNATGHRAVAGGLLSRPARRTARLPTPVCNRETESDPPRRRDRTLRMTNVADARGPALRSGWPRR
jgi:hypothetical protein